MAEKRFIGRRIVESDKIRRLALDDNLLATTLYAFLLPYLDKSGRMNANPLLLGAMFEGYPWSVGQLEQAIHDLADVGLLHLYSNGKYGHIIQYKKFHTKQGGFNTPHDKEPASELPGPEDKGSTPVASRRAPEALETPSSTSSGNDPDTYRTSTGEGPAYIELEIETKYEIEKEHSSTHEIQKTSPRPTLAASPPRESHDPGMFMEIWNSHRGRLPAVQSLNSKRRRSIKGLVNEHGPQVALDLFRDATRAVASDDFWLARQYGFDNLLAGKVLQRAEQWRAGAKQLGEANMRLAANVERWGKALPEEAVN